MAIQPIHIPQEAKDVPDAARLRKALDSFKIPAAGEERLDETIVERRGK